MSLDLHVLGCGGGTPTRQREPASYLIRDHSDALLIDAGKGAARLSSASWLLDSVDHLQVVLTHFHYGHICWLPFLRTLNVPYKTWAPGEWLYGQNAGAILDPFRRTPIAFSDYRNEDAARESPHVSLGKDGTAIRLDAPASANSKSNVNEHDEHNHG